MTVKTRRQGAIAYVELNNAPVNAMGLALRQGLLDAVNWVENESGIERVILSGAGRVFAAGGDAKEFDAPPIEPHLPDVLNRIENCETPWIAAAHGAALGGGLELMLSCRVRIAAPKTQLGLPEVTLGVIPGAGGTQRLPRIVGLETAVDMISSGKPVTADQALTLGFIDLVDPDPVNAAETLPTEYLDTAVAVGHRDCPAMNQSALDAARATSFKKQKHQIAPQKAIDLVEMSAHSQLVDGLKAERACFVDLRNTSQAKALRHMFFAERANRQPRHITCDPVDISTVAVVGGGTMGAGITYALLNAGLSVVLLETDDEGVDRARINIDKIIQASLDRSLISAEKEQKIRGCLTMSTDYNAARHANLAIEAAFESMDVKKSIFQSLEAALPSSAVLATNTSYLDVNEIAKAIKDTSRVVGLHFFAPAHIMKLLEIIKGHTTSDQAIATGFAMAKTLRKIPVLAGVCDGFIGNRILQRYREAADGLLLDGTNPWELDEAMEAFGYAMGPYEAQDLSGLDIAYANRQRQAPTRDPNRRYVLISDRMVQEGRLGKKVSVGWYRYPGGNGKVIDPLVEDLVREESHFAKVTRQEFSDSDIQHRLLLAMINEAADILHEGIAHSATDIDLVTVFGYGFPRWRGGLMHYADSIGAQKIFSDLQALAKEDPIVWKPSALIKECAETNTNLSDWSKPQANKPE